MDIKKLRKIAVIGASKNPEKYGNKIVKDLLSKGYEVFPVNPKYEEINGLKCYKDVEELPKDVELLVFVLPPEKGKKIAEKALKLGFKNFWFQPGAESKEIISLLEKKEANVIFGACIMKESKKVKI